MTRTDALSRGARALADDTQALHPRLRIAGAMARMLPAHAFNRLRTSIYRAAGLDIGAATLVLGSLDLAGGRGCWRRLKIGTNCIVNSPLYLDLGDRIEIGDYAAIGHHTVFVTTDHVVGIPGCRCGAWRLAPIVVGTGAWIGACSTLLAGVTVGEGSVVAAGAVVKRDVEPNTLVGGVPARLIRRLDGTEGA